jgi:metallophosphoesterase superfamily enzyme
LQDWLLTPNRAAVHLPTATAVVADLHLGYGVARRRCGEAIPLPSLEQLLAPLTALPEARRLVIAGDLFEDGCDAALAAEFLDWTARVGLELAGIVPGNHDRSPGRVAAVLPLCPEGVRLGEWLVVHGDGELPPGPVVHGHLHPCLRWKDLAVPCYLVGPERIVLPAFSADARGASVLREARWGEFTCHAIAEGVFDLGPVAALTQGRQKRLRPRGGRVPGRGAARGRGSHQ